MEREKLIKILLSDVDKLLQKKPFMRGSSTCTVSDGYVFDTDITSTQTAKIPNVKKTVISQGQFMKELDPGSHEVLFDDNIPSICVRLDDGSVSEIKFKKMPLNIQERIRQKQTLSLCGHKMQFTLLGSSPTENDIKNFSEIKEEWERRNQDGMRTKAVYTQKGLGDAGILYYYDYKGRVKSRLISYEDGYVIISHNDQNGDRVLESIYYRDADGVEHIDSYDDKYLYRKTFGGEENPGVWIDHPKMEHGFPEIPLVTKRGNVAWNDVQDLITVYEIIYNIFLVIQKRHGWGILYIRGKIREDVRKIAGSVILNDTSLDGNGSAEFKAPPSPQGMIDTLNSLFEQIQIGSSTTFLLPKDVKSSGDISALAIMLTQSLDIEGATQGVIDWQNFADKMVRLFVAGLAKEKVNKKENENAVTEYGRLRISAKFKIWRPFNETEYNQMLVTLNKAGIISQKTAIEKNTISTPDEEMRIKREEPKKKESKEINDVGKEKLIYQDNQGRN